MVTKYESQIAELSQKNQEYQRTLEQGARQVTQEVEEVKQESETLKTQLNRQRSAHFEEKSAMQKRIEMLEQQLAS